MQITQELGGQDSFKNRMFKSLTLGLFFILPARITTVFISLSMISLIFNVRNSCLSKESSAIERIGKMLRLHLDQGVLLLPEQTCRWYWDDLLLNSTFVTTGGVFSLRDMIKDNKLFILHRHLVLNKLLDSLPKPLFLKLKLAEVSNKLTIKHNVTSAFLYG